MDYQGFNPTELLELILKKANQDETSGEFVIKDDDDKVILTLTKRGNLRQDLALFVLLFVSRGTNWEKIKKKTIDQWVEVYNYKTAKYGILSKTPPGGYQKTYLTVSRLASCVPHWCVFFAHNGVVKKIVELTLVERCCGCRIPSCLQINMFPSILYDDSNVAQKMLNYCYIYSYFFDGVINKRGQHLPIIKLFF